MVFLAIFYLLIVFVSFVTVVVMVDSGISKEEAVVKLRLVSVVSALLSLALAIAVILNAVL